MLANNRRKILQHVIDDPASTEVERAEATRELNATAPSTPPSSRRGRNANVPMAQQDQDADIENSFRYDAQLTTQDRIEIDRSLDQSTRSILAAFGSSILWLFANNAAEIQLLIDLHGKTHSDFVRAKTIQTIRWIADYSPIESAKTAAQQFLNQLDSSTEKDKQ
jgi:hypothetical protein